MIKFIIHLFSIAVLTVITQIGGLLYLVSILFFRIKAKNKALKRIGFFILLYLTSTFFIVPQIAPIFGREKIQNTDKISAHSLFYIIANRNYVKPELNLALSNISKELDSEYPGIKLIYLDANFPFIDGFPLLPHLSHDDGGKIDVSLIYEYKQDSLTNKKPSISGYGVYEGPLSNEVNQITTCKSQGHWQYDFPKYMTLGRINKELSFSLSGTKAYANIILKQQEIAKMFIEPHLKNRLNLTNSKVRFHGCHAVRHDDHIHFQL